uniref:Uncharacterized protein n=1 Tax=Solanum tuberosum TaxID=4113 RepID=M1DHK4_SOLTU
MVGKQATKKGKETGRGNKRQPMRGLIDEEEAFKEDINCITPQPTQESQPEFHVASNIYIPVPEDEMKTLG